MSDDKKKGEAPKTTDAPKAEAAKKSPVRVEVKGVPAPATSMEFSEKGNKKIIITGSEKNKK